ncbi:MAG: hypothetical protein AAB528_00200, partial [Chloroflexota bacterium]
MSKKKIAQIPLSQAVTGTPGDLSWIDDIRRRRANLEEKRKAKAAREVAEQAKYRQQVRTA